MKLGTLDISILVLYLVTTAGIGFWVGRREKQTTRDYFLAGSRLPWYAVGLSMVASSISTEQFMGEVGYAYRYGLAVANWEWLIFPALTILIWVFTPFYIRGNITTMPEFLERRYGIGSRTIFASLTILSYAVVNLPLVLYSGSLALEHIFGIPFRICAVGLAVLTGAYTVYGGLSSVVWTDVFQCILLLLGGLLIFFLGITKVDGGWAAIIGTGDRAHLVLPASHEALPWTAMLALALCTNIWYYCTNQYINQRCLGAKDEWHAKMGMVFCGFLGFALALAVTFPGLIAHAINPNLEDPNIAYPYLVLTLVPSSLKGILLAALISAIMSTVSSLVNSTATIFTIDVYERLVARPEVSQEHLIGVGRWAGILIMVIGLACVPLVGMWDYIFSYCQEIWVLLAGPTVAAFLVGVFWKKATPLAATVTMSTSFPLMAVPFIQKAHPILPGPLSNIFVFGLAVFGGCVTLMIAVSLFSRAIPETAARQICWNLDMLRLPESVAAQHTRWYHRVGFWWLLMFASYGTLYFIFW